MDDALKEKKAKVFTKALLKTPSTPANFEPADASAIQAIMRGDADAHQQQRGMKWIIESAARTYGFSYYPIATDTSFALGMTFVGQQIVKLSKLNVSSLTKEN